MTIGEWIGTSSFWVFILLLVVPTVINVCMLWSIVRSVRKETERVRDLYERSK